MQIFSMRSRPSYTPTDWQMVNRLLDIADIITNGRADWIQRFFSYSFFGGTAAVVNLAIFYVTYKYIKMPVSDTVHWLIAQILAFEISLMVNFIPNDYFTFSRLAGHQRSWGARCLRYHITSIVGLILTLLISFGLHYGLNILGLPAQAIALILVFVYNFAFHHLFTYRHAHKKGMSEKEALEKDALALAKDDPLLTCP